MNTIQRMKPSTLRYTHDSVGCTFSDGTNLEDTFGELLDNDLDVDDLPPLVAMWHNNNWFVVRGNRRLYIYKKLEDIGKISTVRVQTKTFNKILFSRQNTSKDNGKTIRIRGNPFIAEKLDRFVKRWKARNQRGYSPPLSYSSGIYHPVTVSGPSYTTSPRHSVNYSYLPRADTSEVMPERWEYRSRVIETSGTEENDSSTFTKIAKFVGAMAVGYLFWKGVSS